MEKEPSVVTVMVENEIGTVVHLAIEHEGVQVTGIVFAKDDGVTVGYYADYSGLTAIKAGENTTVKITEEEKEQLTHACETKKANEEFLVSIINKLKEEVNV